MSEVLFMDYTIVIDPNNSWGSIFDFEKALLEFFDKNNIQADALHNLPDYPKRHMIYIRGRREAPAPPEVQTTPSVGPQKALKNIVENIRLQNLPKK